MKKIIVVLTLLLIGCAGRTQNYIQASIRQGALANTADITFLPNYTSAAGEYVNYLSISIAVPTSAANNLVPTIATTGPFTGMSLVVASPFSYPAGTETIYSWIYSSGPSTMSWTSGIEFTGATITFNGSTGVSKVRLVDFTNYVPSGGPNSNTFFLIVTNKSPFDVANYSNLFYSIGGGNGSTPGTYGNGDQFTESNLLISLPIHLVSFSGYKNGNKNTLQWTTANESNNMGFEVQRSVNGTNFTTIGFVPTAAAGGNSNGSLSYSFDDQTPTGIKQYYRLNQIDVDQRGRFSSIVLITGGKPSFVAISRVFPNPANDMTNVIIESPGKQEMKMIVSDMNGRILKQQIVQTETGSNTVPVAMDKWAAGTYLVKLICADGNEIKAIKISKQ